MKKILSFMLSISMCLCLTSTALAAMADTNTNTDDFVYIWTTLQESGALSVGNDGLLHVDENNELCKSQGYSEFIELVNICNESIHDGILVADPDTVEVISVIQPEEEEVPYGLISQNDFLDDEINIMPLNAAHGCSVQACDLLTMCRNNYKTLSDYHMQMLQLVLVNPNLSPWGATVGFWVSKVEPGGDWDYKVRPGFAPYNSMFCSYFDGNFNHITSEYIGNFNYGYTGSFLFSLNVLHFGSSAVAHFDPADEEDWPAIDAGYNNATN